MIENANLKSHGKIGVYQRMDIRDPSEWNKASIIYQVWRAIQPDPIVDLLAA